MKEKFIIAQAGSNCYWSYFGGLREPFYPKEDKSLGYICNQLDDCFLNGSIKEAKQFNSYEEAQKTLEAFGKMIKEEKVDDKVITSYLATGIYKIEKIFVYELP